MTGENMFQCPICFSAHHMHYLLHSSLFKAVSYLSDTRASHVQFANSSWLLIVFCTRNIHYYKLLFVLKNMCPVYGLMHGSVVCSSTCDGFFFHFDALEMCFPNSSMLLRTFLPFKKCISFWHCYTFCWTLLSGRK